MKKIVSIITMAAMLAVSSPAVAGGRDRDYRWGVDHNRHGHSEHRRSHKKRERGVSTGGAIAIGVGGIILGAVIANSNRNTRNDRYNYPVQQRQPQYVCQDVVQYDYYGNPYVAGRNCWYQ
jgi:Ni/Co efflux regulator RcnB